MSNTLIAADNVFGLLGALFALIAFAVYAEGSRIGKRLSAASVVIGIALLLSQFSVLPRTAPLYDAVWEYMVPLAIAIFLIKANLLSVVQEGGRVLLAFSIGMAGVVAGAVLGASLIDLGPHEAQFVGIFSATYTGGSLNFAAVAEATEFREASLLSAALAVDTIWGTAFIVVANLLGGWSLFQRFYAERDNSMLEAVETTTHKESDSSISLPGISIAIGLAAVVCAVSIAVAARLGLDSYAILFISVFMAVIATVFRKVLSRLRGENVLALLLMYLFFAIVGAGTDVGAMFKVVPELSAFVAIILSAHLLFLLIGGCVFRLSYGELIVGSLACITGPPVAAAIAILFGWRRLVAAGILTGVFGYLIGNFVGVGLHALLGGN